MCSWHHHRHLFLLAQTVCMVWCIDGHTPTCRVPQMNSSLVHFSLSQSSACAENNARGREQPQWHMLTPLALLGLGAPSHTISPQHSTWWGSDPPSCILPTQHDMRASIQTGITGTRQDKRECVTVYLHAECMHACSVHAAVLATGYQRPGLMQALISNGK